MTDYNLQEELLSLSGDPNLYPIENELDIPDLSSRAIDAHLSSAVTAIVNDPDSILHSRGETLDVFASVLKHADAPSVDGAVLQKTLDAIVSGLNHHSNAVMALVIPGNDDIDAPLQHKAQLENWAFLLQWFVAAAERGAGRAPGEQPAAAKRGKGKKKEVAHASAFQWVDHLPLVLGTMHRALRIPTSRVWRTTSEREAFVSCFTKPAYQLAEAEAYLKVQEVKLGVYKVICLAVKFHGHAFGAQTSIVQNLTYFEHMSEPMAELLAILEKEFDYPQLAEEVLRDVASKTFSHTDAKGPRSFSRFLIRLAELCPRVVGKQMPLLMAHLDSEVSPTTPEKTDIRHTPCAWPLSRSSATSSATSSWPRTAPRTSRRTSRSRTTLISCSSATSTSTRMFAARFLRLSSSSASEYRHVYGILIFPSLPVKFPKQRAKITDLTIRSLEDKTSSVRRYSIQLLCKLLETHPFAAGHGGTLHLPEWQERYDKLSAELEKIDTQEMEKARRDAGMDDNEDEDDGAEKEKDSEDAEDGDDENMHVDGDEDETPEVKKERKPRKSQLDIAAIETEQATMDPQAIMTLRLTKKYYTDALRFINQIEAAIPTLCQLLVSTNKTEVLESMRFFRTAFEYNIASAEQGIKTMLHLIWSKDNNTISSSTEDGMDTRSIRGNLIDVYRSLYFDVVPDLTPKQQVNRIAKNMIERTYGATLAEITSLEELMRTMMAEGAVHPDVVNKLWQVYSTDQEIPKAQRQGAIIILGMLGLARRDVIAERVDSLLKIGLGPLGMNDFVLARYSCIALQRLGGSAKKVKGRLTIAA
jgi:condensin complex subunit 1